MDKADIRPVHSKPWAGETHREAQLAFKAPFLEKANQLHVGRSVPSPGDSARFAQAVSAFCNQVDRHVYFTSVRAAKCKKKVQE